MSESTQPMTFAEAPAEDDSENCDTTKSKILDLSMDSSGIQPVKTVAESELVAPGELKAMNKKARVVIQDVKAIKAAQVTIKNQLEHIEKENGYLYGDMSYAKEKLTQQQIIVDKLLHFLMTMVGGRKTFLKRSFPYLLEDDELIAKRAKALKYVQTAETEVEIKVDCTELNIESNDDVEQPGTSQVAKVAPAEICSITEDIQDDINVLYDILKSKNGMDLPRETVEKLFDQGDTVVPPVPHEHLAVSTSASPVIIAGPVPIAAVTATVLESKQITQQEIVNVAALITADQESKNESKSIEEQAAKITCRRSEESDIK